MLVLSRKRNETIVITAKDAFGNDVTINVICGEIRGDKVRIGIDAPKEITVNRKEVYDAIQRHRIVDNLSKVPDLLDEV